MRVADFSFKLPNFDCPSSQAERSACRLLQLDSAERGADARRIHRICWTSWKPATCWCSTIPDPGAHVRPQGQRRQDWRQEACWTTIALAHVRAGASKAPAGRRAAGDDESTLPPWWRATTLFELRQRRTRCFTTLNAAGQCHAALYRSPGCDADRELYQTVYSEKLARSPH